MFRYYVVFVLDNQFAVLNMTLIYHHRTTTRIIHAKICMCVCIYMFPSPLRLNSKFEIYYTDRSDLE